MLVSFTKIEKDEQFFGQACPWGTRKKFQLVRKVGYVGGPYPKISVMISWYVRWATILSLIGDVYTKEFIRYCSALNIEETCMKVIQIGGWYPDKETRVRQGEDLVH